MTLDWCPGIREACGHWRSAPMLPQLLSGALRVPDAEAFLAARGL